MTMNNDLPIDDLFMNPPEPSCYSCKFKRWSETEQGFLCIHIDSPLYTEDIRPADWCGEWEKWGITWEQRQ